MAKKYIIFDLDGVILSFLFFLNPGSKKVLKKIKESNKYNLVVLTARRNKILLLLARIFLCIYGLKFLNLLSSNGTKSSFLKEKEECFLFVESSPKNIKEIRGLVREVVYFSYFRKKSFDGLKPIHSWDKILEKVPL